MDNTGLVLDAYSFQDLKDFAKKADKSGFHSLWATELYRTSFQQLAAVAPVTETIKLGTSVSLAFTRSPLITALTALDLDEISGGRIILGLGTGAKRTNENFHGVEYGKPVKHITECVEILRKIISESHTGNDIRYEGEYYKINMKGYRRPFTPQREQIPVFLAGIGNNMTEAAAIYGDGYIGHVVCSLEYLKKNVIPSLEKGLGRNYRSRNDFTISSIITCAVSDDLQKAKRAAKATIAFYALVRTYEKPFRLHGFLSSAGKIRKSYFNRDIEAMIDNVSDEMVDTFAIVGDETYCKYRLEKYREIIDLPILSVPHYFIEPEEIKMYQDNLIQVFGK